MEKDGTKRARHYALLAGNTLFLINVTISIFYYNGICGTIFLAFWFFTLPADNGHPDNRMGINNYHPDAALFGIINSKTIDGTDHFTKPTARTSLWKNR
jgi:hypothetical protein